MTVLGKFESGQVLSVRTVAGPASYATATPPTILLNDLQQSAEQVVAAFGNAGRLVQIVSISGRTVTFRVRGQPAALSANAGLPEVADATDLSAETYTFIVVGR